MIRYTVTLFWEAQFANSYPHATANAGGQVSTITNLVNLPTVEGEVLHCDSAGGEWLRFPIAKLLGWKIEPYEVAQ